MKKILLLILTLCIFSCLSNESEENEGYPAPDFSLQDENGNTHNLADYQGKVLLLNFIGFS